MKAQREGRKGWIWALPAVVVIGGLLAGPLAGLVRLSFCRGGGQSGFGIGGFYEPGTWTVAVWRDLLTDGYFWDICGFTLGLGTLVTLICVLAAYPLALAIWKAPRAWKPWMLAGLVVPKLSNLLVTVYGLKLILGDHGPINQVLRVTHLVSEPVALQNNLTGVIIGKSLIVLPYTALFLWAGLEQIDDRLVAAARGLGASRRQAFALITLPLSLPALVAGALISLIWGCGAFISPYLLGSPEQITLAVDVQRQMFENLHWPRAAAQGVFMVAALALVAAVAAAAGRRIQNRMGVGE